MRLVCRPGCDAGATSADSEKTTSRNSRLREVPTQRKRDSSNARIANRRNTWRVIAPRRQPPSGQPARPPAGLARRAGRRVCTAKLHGFEKPDGRRISEVTNK